MSDIEISTPSGKSALSPQQPRISPFTSTQFAHSMALAKDPAALLTSESDKDSIVESIPANAFLIRQRWCFLFPLCGSRAFAGSTLLLVRPLYFVLFLVSCISREILLVQVLSGVLPQAGGFFLIFGSAFVCQSSPFR